MPILSWGAHRRVFVTVNLTLIGMTMIDKPHDVFGRYSDDAPRDQPWCDAGIVLVGEWHPCDLVPPHDGWNHSNREIEAIWHCGTSD